MKDIFYSWDFDENLIYIFECHSPINIEEETYVKNPFNKKYKLTQKFFESLSSLYKDIEKNLTNKSDLEVIFYKFKSKPLDICKFSEFTKKTD